MHVNIHAAKTHLSRLIDQVNAGEEIVITRHGRPVARLVPPSEAQSRKLGLLKRKGVLDGRQFRRSAARRSAGAVRGKTEGTGNGMALRLLLDTHPLVWVLIDRKRIS
jgi:prevent-host-death family protein